MGQYIKVNGIWEEPMVMVLLLTLEAKSMKENGVMIRLKAMEYISIQIMQDMKVNGTKTYNTVKVLRNGKMDQFLLGSIKMVKKMVLASMNGEMELAMKVNGKIMK
jgi:hypothetical protein